LTIKWRNRRNKTMLKKFPTINEIRVFKAQGPWKTSTGSSLSVRVALSFEWVTNSFLGYNSEELANISPDIRGLRVYTVRNIPLERRSSSGFHKVRGEIAMGLDGKVELECEDVLGDSKKFIITPENGIWMPPYLLQTHQALEEDSGLILIANTLFVAEKKETHDTYPAEDFRRLQQQIKREGL